LDRAENRARWAFKQFETWFAIAYTAGGYRVVVAITDDTVEAHLQTMVLINQYPFPSSGKHRHIYQRHIIIVVNPYQYHRVTSTAIATKASCSQTDSAKKKNVFS
jgi:hypothetical protein